MRGTWILERTRAAAHEEKSCSLKEKLSKNESYWTHSWYLDYSGIGADLGVEGSFKWK